MPSPWKTVLCPALVPHPYWPKIASSSKSWVSWVPQCWSFPYEICHKQIRLSKLLKIMYGQKKDSMYLINRVDAIIIAGDFFERIIHAFLVRMITWVATLMLVIHQPWVKIAIVIVNIRSSGYAISRVVVVALVLGMSPSNVTQSLIANHGWSSPTRN